MNAQLVIGPDHLVGVEAQQRTDGSWQFHWVHVHRRKGNVHIERQGSAVGDAQALAAAVGARYPIVLVLNSERVLMRDVSGEFNIERDLGKLLPNVQPGDLVIGSCASGAKTHVGLVRKQLVDEVLKELGNAGLRITHLFIGPSVLIALRPHMTHSEGTARLGPHNFAEEPDGSLTYRSTTDSTDAVPIGDEALDAHCVMAFAACWQHWFAPLALSTTPIPEVANAVAEERYRLRYEKGLVAVMALLLLLLAGDALLRDHLDNRQANLQEALDRQEVIETELDSLARSLQTRKELIRATGIGHAGSTMRVLDHLAASVPEQVVLTELWLAPATAPLREGEPLKRAPDLLSITGRTQDPAVLPVWVARLKTLEGVRNARLKALEQEPNEGMPVFRIEVDLS